MEQHDYKLLSDDELTLMAAGEATAETELIVRLTPVLYAVARKINPYICEDLLQEGLLAAVRAAKGYHPEKGGARAFLITSARNQMLNVLNKNSIISGSEDPEQELSAVSEDRRSVEELERLRQAIKTCLTDYEREVIRLYLAGFCYAQIAEMLGREAKSVDNAMQRARRKLKIELEKH